MSESELLRLLSELERNPNDRLARMRLAGQMNSENWLRDLPFREAFSRFMMRADHDQAVARAFFEGFFQGRRPPPLPPMRTRRHKS